MIILKRFLVTRLGRLVMQHASALITLTILLAIMTFCGFSTMNYMSIMIISIRREMKKTTVPLSNMNILSFSPRGVIP